MLLRADVWMCAGNDRLGVLQSIIYYIGNRVGEKLVIGKLAVGRNVCEKARI